MCDGYVSMGDKHGFTRTGVTNGASYLLWGTLFYCTVFFKLNSFCSSCNLCSLALFWTSVSSVHLCGYSHLVKCARSCLEHIYYLENREIWDVLWGDNREKWKRPAVTRNRTQTPGLCSHCAASALPLSYGNQTTTSPSQSSIGTAQVVLNALVVHI